MTSEELFFAKTGIRFNEFYTSYKYKAAHFMSKCGVNYDDIPDAVQNGMMLLLMNINNYDPTRGGVGTYAFSIMLNEARLIYKKRGRIKYDYNYDMEKVKYDNDYDYDVEKKAEIIENLILSLPFKTKQVLIMRELKRMPYQEIADTLDVNLSTVKSRIRKGRIEVVRLYNRTYRANL